MGQVVYDLTCGTRDKIYQGGNTFTVRIKRNSGYSAPPASAYPISAEINFTKIHVWSSRGPYIAFGDLFTSGSLSQVSGEFLKVSATINSSSIFSIGTEIQSVTATVKGVGAVNAFDFDSTAATLIVTYGQDFGASTAT